MRYSAYLLTLAATLLASGCARSKVTTEIKPGGSWTRTVVLTGQPKQEGMQTGATLDDSFVIPTGPAWKITDATNTNASSGSDRTDTAVRTLAAGALLKGDITLKGDAQKTDPGAAEPAAPPKPAPLVLVNNVTVTQLAPRRFEYKETLTWVGPPSSSIGANMKAEDLAQIKSALPKSLATDANARAIGEKTALLAIPILFGPGDPLLALGLLHPDLAMRRASQRMGSVMMKALESQFGDKLTPAERREVARNLIETAFTQAKPAKPDPSAGPPDKGGNSKLTSMMFALKTAGKIVSSNGEADDFAGEVFWALFPEAASLKPVTLTAIIEFNP